jgi:hypothetical protein
MEYVDLIKTTPSGYTVEDPKGFGPPTYPGENREWAYVLKAMKRFLDDASEAALEGEDPTDLDPEVANFVNGVRNWSNSFDPDWADPDFFTIPVMTMSSSYKILDDQVVAVRNGAPFVEYATTILDVEDYDLPGVIKPREDPPGFLDKALKAGIVIGVLYLGIRAYEASKKGGGRKSSPLALP